MHKKIPFRPAREKSQNIGLEISLLRFAPVEMEQYDIILFYSSVAVSEGEVFSVMVASGLGSLPGLGA